MKEETYSFTLDNNYTQYQLTDKLVVCAHPVAVMKNCGPLQHLSGQSLLHLNKNQAHIFKMFF